MLGRAIERSLTSRCILEKRFGWNELKRETVVPPGVRLYRWVTARRIDYRDDKIDHWLVVECEAIPGWSWSVFGHEARR